MDTSGAVTDPVRSLIARFAPQNNSIGQSGRIVSEEVLEIVEADCPSAGKVEDRSLWAQMRVHWSIALSTASAPA